MKTNLKFNGYQVWLDPKGYPRCHAKGKELVHVQVWEGVNGPVPVGCVVHHRDLNKMNWEVDNLELLTRGDHLRVHAGWIRDKDGKWTHKICSRCKKLLLLSSFVSSTGKLRSRCKECNVAVKSAWQTKNKERYNANQRASYKRRK